jgi:DNA-binding response OmpR family regulator
VTSIRPCKALASSTAAERSDVLLRAVIASLLRRVLEDSSRRQLHAGGIDVHLTAKIVTVAGQRRARQRLEFELLVKFASDPTRVLSKHELARCIRRLRTRLT